jgi:hypothetical protein
MDRDLIENTTLLGSYIEESFLELKNAKPVEKKKARKRPPMGTKE